MKTTFLLAAIFLVGPVAVSAHDAKGPNGGQMTEAGSYHIEMVMKSDAVDVFISDTNEKPIASSGFKGIAILLVEGRSQRIVLEPADASRLTGKAPALPSSQPKGVVQLTVPDGTTVQAKFN